MASQECVTKEDSEDRTIQDKLAEAMDTTADYACGSEPHGGSLQSGNENSETAAAEGAGDSAIGEKGVRTILILGKTGNGKSSLGNTLTGQPVFAVGRGMFSTTQKAQTSTVNVLGKQLKVIDTPDISNVASDLTTAKNHVMQWKNMTKSCPDVVILTVRCDVRYTKEEHAIYRQVQELWGDNSVFRQRLMVAFTFGDRQDEDLEEELQEVCEELKAVIAEARGRYVQVNNRAKAPENTQQRQDIYTVIDTVLQHNEEAVPAAQAEANHFAVLVLGKTGHGKSSLANLITGGGHFPVQAGPSPLTTRPTSQVIHVRDTTLKVIDMPDVRGLAAHEKQRQIDVWKGLAANLPVVFLLVVRCDVRYTSEDLAFSEELLARWRKGHPPQLSYRMIVVFTFKDRLDYDLDKEVKRYPQLAKLLQMTGHHAMMSVSCPSSAVLHPSASERDRQEQCRARDTLLELIHKAGQPPSSAVRVEACRGRGVQHEEDPCNGEEQAGTLALFVKKSDASNLERDITHYRDATVMCQPGTNQTGTLIGRCAIL